MGQSIGSILLAGGAAAIVGLGLRPMYDTRMYALDNLVCVALRLKGSFSEMYTLPFSDHEGVRKRACAAMTFVRH